MKKSPLDEYEDRLRASKWSDFSANRTLFLWAIVSVGLWLITPEQFTNTDGPGGVFTMIVVAVMGLFISLLLPSLVKRLLGRD